MAGVYLLVFRFLRLLLSGHQAVAIENAALPKNSIIAMWQCSHRVLMSQKLADKLALFNLGRKLKD
jgi:hypothetical protein